MSNIDKKALRQLAEKAISAEGVTWWSEHQLSHEDGLALHDADAKFIAAASPATILALLDEMEVLQSFRTAYMEWSDKTDWVQTDKRLDVIKPWGKHRTDVLKLYIDHLESKLEAKEEQRANWFQMAQKLGEDLDAAEKRIADYHRVLNNLAAVARRYLPDYDEHPDIQAADDLLESAAGIGEGE